MNKEEIDEKRVKLLVEKLKEHPELRERFERILALAENEDGSANTADEAEERAMEEVRKLGQELMQSWALRKHERIVSEYDLRKGYRRKGKKNSTGKPDSDK
jgi:hypothetical protein